MVRERALAKINLFLHVGEKRADGYHDIDSVAVFAEVFDELVLEPSEELTLAVEGIFAPALEQPGDNLVVRAARLLSSATGRTVSARMTLIKNLPVAAGIGGGSADAAAALRGLNALCRLGLSAEALSGCASSLGSDVPVCLESKPARMSGRGEFLTPVELPRIELVLVNPGVQVSTARMFARLDAARPRTSGGVPNPGTGLEELMQHSRNDFEAIAAKEFSGIGRALNALRNGGSRFARMSGSGATCFGLFHTADAAAAAARAIASSHPGWWVRATRTRF